MQAVLGIDAAWTPTQPSGLALVAGKPGSWHLLRVASSYASFSRRASTDATDGRPIGSVANVTELLATWEEIAGGQVDLVAIDMPLARSPITGRRISDDLVSKAYGARQCGTHSPNALRPGPLSDTLRQTFDAAGYALATSAIEAPCLIEVYPHPALVELTGASSRLPYKVSKARSYWPSTSPEGRRSKLLAVWSEIVEHLEREIAGIARTMAPPTKAAVGWQLKAYEDALDAIVCAWVGVCAVEGRAIPFGDGNSAIWIPRPAS